MKLEFREIEFQNATIGLQNVTIGLKNASIGLLELGMGRSHLLEKQLLENATIGL